MSRMLATGLSLKGPCAIRVPRGVAIAGDGLSPDEALPLGKGRVLREGRDACVVAYGLCVSEALRAAEALQADGISLHVVDARFAKPLDGALLEDCARRFDVMLTAEDGVVTGGFGAGVLERLADAGLVPAHFARLGVPDEWVEHGTPEQLRAKCGYDAAGIAAKVRALVGKAKFKVA
jgi:1-deoxy-D-xylulose-5-phosphate synthase